jgi:hypothetical protein
MEKHNENVGGINCDGKDCAGEGEHRRGLYIILSYQLGDDPAF